MPVLRPPHGAGLAALALALSSTACTYIVVEDELHAPLPCAAAEDCASGFACVDGACAAADEADAPPPPGVDVGKAGGTVAGVDDVTVTFPPDALSDEVHVIIERASATNVPVGVDERSGFYAVSPDASVDGASIALPVDGGCAGCAVFRRPDGAGAPWTALDPGPPADGKVSGVLTTLAGVYVAGVEVTP